MSSSSLVSDIWKVLSFQAFNPDAAEASLPLKDRAGQGVIGGLYLGPAQMTSCIIRHTRAGFVFSNITKRPIDFPIKELRPEDFRACFKEKVRDLVVTVGGITDVSLKANIRKQPELSELVMLSTQPQKLLGASFAKNMRYSLLHNGNQNQCFLAATDQLQLSAIADVIDKAQFRIIRYQSALVSALDKVMDEEDVKAGRVFPLILDNGNAFFTKVSAQGMWEGWRFRAKVITSPEDSVLKVFLNSLSLTGSDTLLVVDLGSNYDYPVEKDLEGISFKRFEQSVVGKEYLPFYLSTLN
jgi:hypothetical protein